MTRKFAMKYGRPCIHMDMSASNVEDAVNQLARWVIEFDIGTLNVAGRSASKDEKIYDATFSVIDSLLKQQN